MSRELKFPFAGLWWITIELYKERHFINLQKVLYNEPDRTIFRLPLTASYNLGTNGVGKSDDDNIKTLLEYCNEPHSKTEIQNYLGIKSERYVRQKLINPLLEAGRIVRTIPDKPRNKNQK